MMKENYKKDEDIDLNKKKRAKLQKDVSTLNKEIDDAQSRRKKLEHEINSLDGSIKELTQILAGTTKQKQDKE